MNELITIQAENSIAQYSPIEQFEQAKARFLATRKTKQTELTYARHLADYQRFAGSNDLNPLLADCLIAYNQHINSRRRDNGGNLANGTVSAYLKAVQSFFSWLYTYGLTPLRPGQVSDILTIPRARQLSPRDILTENEASSILLAAKNGKNWRLNKTLIRTMLDGGLRVSEAIGLRACDLYAANDRYYLHVARGKGDKARDVEIPQDLYNELVQMAAMNGIEIADPKHAQCKLFELSRITAWRVVGKAASDISKRITPHSLRHTHAHQLRLLGWPLEAIAHRLGHASVETTKIYTRPAELAASIALPVMPWSE